MLFFVRVVVDSCFLRFSVFSDGMPRWVFLTSVLSSSFLSSFELDGLSEETKLGKLGFCVLLLCLVRLEIFCRELVVIVCEDEVQRS